MLADMQTLRDGKSPAAVKLNGFIMWGCCGKIKRQL